MNYYYQAYGYNISSEIEIIEMIKGGDGKDISISHGKVPDDISNPLVKGKTFQISKNEALITITEVAKFHVSDGKIIVINKSIKSTDEEVKLFLLGVVFGTLLHQRNELLLHANVIQYKEKAILFAGNSGTGKSTLTALLIKNGFKFVSDDIALVKYKGKNPIVYPGLPRLKLHIDSVENLNIDKDKIVQLRKGHKKFNVPVSEHFFNEALPVQKIYIIEPANNLQFSINNIEGFQKFNYIFDYMYLKFYTSFIWDQRVLFNLQSQLASNSKLAVIKNPQNWDKNTVALKKLLSDIEKQNK